MRNSVLCLVVSFAIALPIFLLTDEHGSASEPTDLGTMNFYGVSELSLSFEGCSHFNQYQLVIEDREIPADEYEIVCSDDDFATATVELDNVMVFDHIPSYALNGIN